MARIVIAAAIVAVAFAGCGGGGATRQAEDLQSAAAEGALLARETAQGDSLTPFTRVHARDLRDVSSPLQEDAATARLRRLARVVTTALETLETHPGDRGRAAGVAVRLRAASAVAERLAAQP